MISKINAKIVRLCFESTQGEHCENFYIFSPNKSVLLSQINRLLSAFNCKKAKIYGTVDCVNYYYEMTIIGVQE